MKVFGQRVHPCVVLFPVGLLTTSIAFDMPTPRLASASAGRLSVPAKVICYLHILSG
jgi:hypothetical protein